MYQLLPVIRVLLGNVVDSVEPVYHLPGEQNPADLGTRGHAALRELGLESVWQKGPHFLTEMDRNKWPLTRDFRDSVPQSELRSKHEVNKHVYIMQVKVGKSMAVIQKLVEASLCTNTWMNPKGYWQDFCELSVTQEAKTEETLLKFIQSLRT